MSSVKCLTVINHASLSEITDVWLTLKESPMLIEACAASTEHLTMFGRPFARRLFDKSAEANHNPFASRVLIHPVLFVPLLFLLQQKVPWFRTGRVSHCVHCWLLPRRMPLSRRKRLLEVRIYECIHQESWKEKAKCQSYSSELFPFLFRS